MGVLAATAFMLAVACAAHGTDAPAAAPGTADQIAAELGLKESAKPLREMFPDWRTPKKVMVDVGNDSNRLNFMQEVVPPGVTLVAVKDKQEALQRMLDIDGLIAPWGCDPDTIAAAGRRLRWVQVSFAGVNRCGLKQMRERGIVLTNSQRVLSPEISDHVMALILALSRGLDGTLSMQRQGKWRRESVTPTRLWSLQGRTLLVVGLGGIGTEVAQKAHAMGMRVIATRNSSREGPAYVEYVGLADELPKLIGQADVVVNALPLTSQTKGLFNAAMFERMQKHAYFVSVGRGATTDTGDLIAALKNGTIGGAGLDVTDPEPLPEGHPLWFAPNVIITPHIAPFGEGSGGKRSWWIAREQLRRFVVGDRLYSVVDLNKGY